MRLIWINTHIVALEGDTMTWKDEIKKENKEDMRKYNEGANMMYDIINKYLQLGVLDYDKHLMEFTKIVDIISEKLE